eukprot:CAMPEP_0119322530 /NCGR_PEP_ID=MMETSP1333-20130426/58465_1 /TAXON_ID=418940 /ORGANISM="Scyphosphaera apsteinii, Strain RCC1455" /LENGTH=350 /DNA_ID=CAMNT_0007329781 /DNA_START=72 /DNA_END=1125 /DNA_ORIENTATION=+
MLQQIQSGIKLRRTATVDKSAPHIGTEALEQEWEADKNENYYLDLGLEQWLPFVHDISFATTSISLSQDDAKDTADGGSAFCKLSGRSPKDAPLHTARLLEAHSERCRQCGATDNNARLSCLFDAALELMRVRNVAHCLWLLINSFRIDEDLDVAARHADRWEQSVVFRSWWPGVSTDLEFRMFVSAGRPTGMTQYNHLVHSQRLASNASRIGSSLLAYYEAHLRPRLEGTQFATLTNGRFVIDFAVHPDALASESDGAIADEFVRVIELNCFYEATGMGLFDYHKDADQLNGGPFELRVRTEPLPHAEVKMENEWRTLLRGESDTRRHTDQAWRQLEEQLTQPAPSDLG